MAPSKRSDRTRKPARAKVKAKAKARSTGPVAPASGPVTLAEAKSIARAKQPKLAVKAVRKGALPPESPAAIGVAREERDRRWHDELARRVREYKATMDIMKRRGARRARPKRAKEPADAEPKSKSSSFVPLQIFAEGDSWFDYPALFFGGGIIPRLENLLGVPILNLAKAGDEVRYMLGVEERLLLADHLSKGCPAGGPWDALLFSGGGNDIVDNPMALWVKDWDPTVPAAQLVHQQRFDAALALVRAGYEDLIQLRDRLSPGTVLVFQGYDFAIPDGRGICHLGPWLKPTFDLRSFPTLAARQEVVKAMLQQFAAMLTGLAVHANVIFINGQGTLLPQKSSWHNELHPSKKGFQSFANLFHRELKALFPARVV